MTGDAAARAARLLRWYPGAWRDRYGAEFTELLISDIEERPRSSARTVDVARGGIVARLAQAGLCGVPAGAGPGGRAGASLGSLGCAAGVFLASAAAQWSQLTIGWQWAAPAEAGAPATVATVVTSAAMLAFLGLAAAAALPVLCVIAMNFSRRLLAPAGVLLAAGALLFTGGRHFGNGWPGTGGHHGLVPAGLAAFEWAASLSVSAYWAHPRALAAFPAPELAWMAVSPLALAALVAAAAALVRRAALPPRLLGFETRLAALACAAMAVLLAGCGCWVAAGGRRGLTHPGLIDVAGIAVMAVALAVSGQAARTARLGLRSARG